MPLANAAASLAGTCAGSRPRFFQRVDLAGERARRPALVVDVLGLEDLFQQPDLIVGVEDGEIRLEGNEFGMAAQDLGADRMERPHPGEAVVDPGQGLDALAHFARRLVGEGNGKDLVPARAKSGDEVGDAGRQHARLADAGAGEHQHRPVDAPRPPRAARGSAPRGSADGARARWGCDDGRRIRSGSSVEHGIFTRA